LPAQLGDQQRERDDRRNGLDPTARSSPGGDTEQHGDDDQKGKGKNVLGRHRL